MIEPTGYTALDLIGFTDRGVYDPDAYYVKNDITSVGNTKWRCLIDDTHNITPTEGANWTIYLESATSLAGMDDVTLTSPKNGDGLVHDGNDWTNVPIMTKEQWKKNGAYNLCLNIAGTQVLNGVTFTKKSDGTLEVANTSSASILLTIASNVFLPAGDYRFTGIPDSSNTEGKYQGIVRYHNGTDIDPAVRDRGSNKALTLIHLPSDGYVDVFLSISASIATNFTYKPMITTDLNATYADYVPYAKTNGELTEWTLAENIKSQTSYATGMDSTKLLYYVCKFGKVVTVNFVAGGGTLMIPSTAWGKTNLVTGLPEPLDGSPRASGYSINNKIKFAIEIIGNGIMRLVRDENTTTSESVPDYWGMSITYICK